MRFISSGRQTGKTYRLLREMSKEPRIHMMCASEQRADNAWRMSNDLGYQFARWRFHGPDEAIGWRSSRAHPSIRIDIIWVLDQADDILAGLLNAEIRYVTVNSPVESLPDPPQQHSEPYNWWSEDIDASSVQQADEA